MRRLSAAGNVACNDYRVVTAAPVMGTSLLQLTAVRPAIAVRCTGANATGSVWENHRCRWTTTYDIRRFNDELVIRLCYRA